MLTINADDWGWTEQITDRILSCYQQKKIHSASGMTFMRDSERAADLAAESGLEVGLHLNLIQEFTGINVYPELRSRHERVASYLRGCKANQVLWNPFLRAAVEYVVQAQCEEYRRLYGCSPARLDGHHHMHLCMNMLLSGLIPKGLRVRRNLTFGPGEKGPLNRLYRGVVDRWLTSRCRTTDFFFSIRPMRKERLKRIFQLSTAAAVELMVHPGVQDEYQYLLGDEWSELLSNGLSNSSPPQ
jgi:predicted glycoside hydrolase/deacetylase ChbG (UPF0249 family)